MWDPELSEASGSFLCRIFRHQSALALLPHPAQDRASLRVPKLTLARTCVPGSLL